MDKYMQHVELRHIEVSFPIETAPTSPRKQSNSPDTTSPRKQSNSPDIMLMKPSRLAHLEEPSDDHISTVNDGPTSQNPFDFLATSSQQAFIPNSSPSTSPIDHPETISTTTAQVGIGLMNSSVMADQSLPHEFPNASFLGRSPPKQRLQEYNNPYHVVDGFLPQRQRAKANVRLPGGCLSQSLHQQQVPLIGYTNLKDQAPYIDQQTFFSFHGPNPTYLNPTFDFEDTNWDGINAYLLGKVRPSPDIAHIYKCDICGMESPNAQAYGGHLSSHRKNKRRENLAANRQQYLKKFDMKASANIGKAIVGPSSRKSTPMKKLEDEKNGMKSKKVDFESEN